MYIRSALGALDVNWNAGREQAKTGQGTLRWGIKVDRAGKKFTVQPVKQEKCEQWKKDILDLVTIRERLKFGFQYYSIMLFFIKLNFS